MDQEQERGKGFIDHANDFIGLGRKAFGTSKKLGSISGIFGGGGEAAAAAEAGAVAGEAGAAGATSEVWVPIVVVLLIIIIFTFFLTGATAPGGIGGGGSSSTSATLVQSPVSTTCSFGLEPYCSPGDLQPYFGDPMTAQIFSKICQRESTSNPYAINTGCMAPDPNKRTLDYSVGLFQINLLAHCSGALNYGGDPNSPSSIWCTIIDQTKLDYCMRRFLDPIENINYAVGLYKDSGLAPWTADVNTCSL